MKKLIKLLFHRPPDMAVFFFACMVFSVLNIAPGNSRDILEYYQDQTVTGKVTSSEDGSPLIGVNISIKGTATGTISDSEGDYSINIGEPDAILVFSYVGFLTQEIPVNGRNIVDVQMTTDTRAFDEVVVIGYGTQKKVNLSGAVDVITTEEIENRPVSNVGQALQGLAPNLNVAPGLQGGEVGAKMDINIRGLGSINGGTPYILVDGVEQDINSINPADIESISVLKDAASAAIYGARAAFGVILITTKRGRSDGLSVTYSNNYSFSAPTRVPHPANSIDLAEYFNIGAANSKVLRPFVPQIIEFMHQYQAGEIDDWTMPNPTNPQFWLSYNGGWANTNWYEETYKSWVPNNTHTLSLSGGNEKTQYYISGSLFNQAGLFRYGEDKFQRYTINTKVNTSMKEWLRFNFLSRIGRTNIEKPSYELSTFYYSLSRQWQTNAPYYPDGNLAGEAFQIWLERGGRYNEDKNNILIVPGIEIEPVKNWIIYLNYRWKYDPSEYTKHRAKVYGTDAYGLSHLLEGENYFTMASHESTYNSPNIYSTYSRNIGKHDFTLMAGFEQELNRYKWNSATRYDLVSDELPSLRTATGRDENDGSIGHFSTRSYFGRLNYSFNEKYLLELSLRYDGSSKFQKGYRWGLFPSGSAAYIISKEKFWSSLNNVVNVFKIRASYGSLGNQDVDNYLYVKRLQLYNNLPYIMGDERPNYVQMANLISPDITWEKVRTSNIGIDAGLFRNRMNISFDYFVRNTLDMLGPPESYPVVLGTEIPKANNAELRTNGFEFVLGWRESINKFSYSIRFMLADAKSTITEYYNPQKLLSSGFYKGAALREIWGYTTAGLFESDEQAQDPGHDQSYLSQKPWYAGDVNYADLNNDGKVDKGLNTVDDPGDLSIIGNSTPRYTFSTQLGASWKGFQINLLFQGVLKRDLALDGTYFWGMLGSKWWNIALEEHLDYWTEENTDAFWPRPYYENWDAVKNHQTQTRYLQNGAYIRLKTIQLSYTFPSTLTQRIKIQNLRVFASGENLLTYTKLIGIFDPEMTGGLSGSGTLYPIQKVISAGINVTF